MAYFDIDIDKIEDAPDDEEGKRTITTEVDQAYRLAPYYQQRMAYTWMQNIHFLLGDQHIFYNQVSRQFELLPTTKNNQFVPRPVTNLCQPIFSTMVSNLTRNKPNVDVSPNSPNEKDISAARIASMIQDVKWEDDNEEEKAIDAAGWAVTCGTVFRKDYWDTSYGKIVRIPKMELTERPYLDEQGQIQVAQEEKPVYNEDGTPSFDELPLGDNAVDIVDPFRVIVDPNATSEFSMAWIMETSIQRLSWIKENFMKDAPGFTGEAANVKEESDLSILVSLRQRLKTLSSRGSGSYTGSTGSDQNVKNAAVVKELYIRPTAKHPRGMLIVVAGGKILFQGDSPYYDGSPDSWHPYTVFRYETIPGRFWGKSLLEDLIEPQRRINAIDSLVILNRKTMAAPQRLVPHGCGIPEGYWSGAPGLQLEYRPVGANGAKPEVINGQALPAQVYQEREVTKNEMQQIARTNEVLQGIRPPGVTTYGGLQLLLEQSFNSLAPIIARWEKWLERGQTKKLKLIAHKYREPRPEFINKLRSLNKDIADVDIANFIGSDLRDNCQVRIEAGSSLPRSKVARDQQLMDLATTGILGDLINDPVNKQEFLDKIGVKGFDANSEADVKRAHWENEMFDNNSPQNVMILEYENHEIHKTIHMNRMKEPSFLSLPPDLQMAYNMHVQQHVMILQQQAIQQAQQNALMQGNLPSDMSKEVSSSPKKRQAAQHEPEEQALQ